VAEIGLDGASDRAANRRGGGMVIEIDRLNAIRLLQALIAAGKDSSAPIAKAWINKKAWKIGLGRYELASVLG